MPLPSALSSLVRAPRFWSDYFWDTEPEEDGNRDEDPYRALQGCRLAFPVSPEHALTLDLDESLSYFSLGFQHPGAAETVEVAWDDQAHWHPHVLRWEELDLVGRCVALNDPELPHPGLPLLLLNRFAPICLGDDVDVIFPLLESAWHSLDLFDDREIDRQIEQYDRRQGRFTWRHHEGIGWAIEQDQAAQGSSGFYLYTLRSVENEEFPFAAWNQMVTEARRTCERAVDPAWLAWNGGTVETLARQVVDANDLGTAPILADALTDAGCEHPTILNALRSPDKPARTCWVVELLLGLEPGSFLRRHFGPTRRPLRILYRFEIEVPIRNESISLPPGSGGQFAGLLDQALSEADLGGATVSGGGSSYTQDGQLLEEHVSISAHVRGDVERGIRLIRQTLGHAGVPEGTRIRQSSPERREIPLDPDRVPGGTL